MRFNRHSARLALMAATVLATAAIGTNAFAQGAVQSCGGLQVQLLSLSRSGPGDISAQFSLLNNNNDDMAMFVYYGGSNGRNTFLIDDAGNEWPKKRMDGNGNHRQALMAGVRTNYSLGFHISAGGQNAHAFQVVAWTQLLPLTGMGERGWCKFQFANVPAS